MSIINQLILIFDTNYSRKNSNIDYNSNLYFSDEITSHYKRSSGDEAE